MKNKCFMVFAGFILTIGFMACDNGTTSEAQKTIAAEYRGKWEVASFSLASEPSGTNHTLPYTLNGVTINSAGYEIGDTYIKTFVNGVVVQNTTGLYSSDNSIYNSAGQSGFTIQISGNNAIVTTMMEIDYCAKVTNFSWE
jgi:hypothetical protein